MKLERIQTIQRLPIQIEEAWDFFTSPKNLRLTTPHWLDFRLTSDPPEYLHPGTIVSATIRPFPVISTDWISEITHIRPPQFYITEQRFGPFKMWHHEHHFRAIDDGVEVEDIILYGMHFGMIGSMVHNLFIRKRLHEAFSFRAQALEQRFGSINKPRKQQPQQPSIADVFQQQMPPKPAQKPVPTLEPQQPKTSIQQLEEAMGKTPAQPQSAPQNPRPKPPPKPRPTNQPPQQAKPAPKPSGTPGKPVPQKVTLDDIFRGTDD